MKVSQRSLAPIAVCLAVLMLGACQSLPIGHRESIDAIIIQNLTDDTLDDVVLRVSGTSTILSTNRILPLRDFSMAFAAEKNQRRSATLSWVQNGQAFTREIKIFISKDLQTDVPSRVVLTVEASGVLRSRIEPHPRGQ